MKKVNQVSLLRCPGEVTLSVTWQLSQILERIHSQLLTVIRNIRMEIHRQVCTLKHDLRDM
jgi:hypothetical protein